MLTNHLKISELGLQVQILFELVKRCHVSNKITYLTNRLTSQEVFSIGDEIEEVNRKMLEKLLEENDFVAVYFCKFYLIL